MNITHNSNNDWRDEAKMIGLDEDYIKWIEKVIEDEKKKATEDKFGFSEQFSEILQPNLDIDSHKDWYYCSICFDNHGNDKSRATTLRWYKCVIFSKDKKHAESLAHRKACIKKYPFESIQDIDLYKNNYKPGARQLVADNNYIY